MTHTHTACPDCKKGRPVTRTGHCLACSYGACAEGDGDKVGLPAAPNVAAAIAAANRHLWRCPALLSADPDTCPVCVHITSCCPECGKSPEDMNSDDLAAHVLTDGGSVLVGCEGYQTPLLRAAYINQGGENP